MKSRYLLASLLLSFRVTANPLVGNFGPLHSKVQITESAPDPPATGPLPVTTDGVMSDGSVINYTPNSCWTVPVSRPPVSQPYAKGTCSVCVLQRNGTNGEADYQFWARDNHNNAMGNMGGGVPVWPLDGARAVGDNQFAVTNMGQSPLNLTSMVGTLPAYSMVFLNWDGKEDHFDPFPPSGSGDKCNLAGTATAGQVIYIKCTFDC